MECVKCKGHPVPPENGGRAPLCRFCRSELALSGQEERLWAIDRACSEGARFESFEELEQAAREYRRTSLERRIIWCEVCASSEPYDPMKVRQGWPCERCHRNGLDCCMAVVVHKDFGGVPKTMCKLCRAELELSGQPVEEMFRNLPGMGGKS